MSLQAVEATIRKNPQGSFLICHVRDDGDRADCWFKIGVPATRKVESRGNTSVFRAQAPKPEPDVPVLSTPKPSEVRVQPAPSSKEDVQPALRALEKKIERLQCTMEDFSAKLDTLLHGNNLIDEIRQRNEFLRQAEANLDREAHSLEQERAELDQIRDELNRRQFDKVTA